MASQWKFFKEEAPNSCEVHEVGKGLSYDQKIFITKEIDQERRKEGIITS